MTLGVQLFTLREFTQTLGDFAETLRRVADIGYSTVQVSNTCDYEPDWLEEQLLKSGLQCPLVDFDKPVTSEYIMLATMPGGIGDYDAFRERFEPLSREFAAQGRQLLYHNHVTEFAKTRATPQGGLCSSGGLLDEAVAKFDDKNYLERIADDLPDMGFVLDTYWIQAAGGDPAWWIRRFAGRIPCVHFKDMAYNNGIRMAPVYEGNINFDAVLDACRESGTKHIFVEQDNCYGEDPFECIKRSYANLKRRV
jgi:sugar phosphate isomerase/epimerase